MTGDTCELCWGMIFKIVEWKILRLYPKLIQLWEFFCMSAFGGDRSSNPVSVNVTQNNRVYRQERHTWFIFVCSFVGDLPGVYVFSPVTWKSAKLIVNLCTGEVSRACPKLSKSTYQHLFFFIHTKKQNYCALWHFKVTRSLCSKPEHELKISL